MAALSRHDLRKLACTLLAQHGRAALRIAKRRALQATDPAAREAWCSVAEVIEQREPGNDNAPAA